MSDNSPYRVGGEPSKTRPSAPARLAPTRHNDAFCLVDVPPFYDQNEAAAHVCTNNTKGDIFASFLVYR